MSSAIATDIQSALIADSDTIAPGRTTIPTAGPELFAFLYYIACGLISSRQAMSAPATPSSSGEP